MKVLFIGGTGNISKAVSHLAVSRGFELYHLNRGNRPAIPSVHTITADWQQLEQVLGALEGRHFDVVVNWIAFTAADIERDLDLFRGKTGQYIFISSASAYQRPVTHPIITESTPLANPFWEYSRNKIACEERLMRAYRTEGFPVTIVRPSLTYDMHFPIAIGGWDTYTLPERMLKGQPVIVHGDGTSLWTVTHSEDFAKGMVGLLGHPQAIGHAFHITSDQSLTWDQIYTTIAHALGVEPVLVHISSEMIAKINPGMGAGLLGDKASSVIFDNTKIKRFVPDFVASIPFHEGIRRTLAWYDEDERRKRFDAGVSAAMDHILNVYTSALSL